MCEAWSCDFIVDREHYTNGMEHRMSKLYLEEFQQVRLTAQPDGRHQFGGPAKHSGVIPVGSDVPIQLVLSLDVTDPLFPIKSERGISALPLYYPFKYGVGGPEIQYAVRSDSDVEILYMSDSLPDDADSQYLQVDDLPYAAAAIEPLTDEQARLLALLAVEGRLQPNVDRSVFDGLDLRNLIQLGGKNRFLRNAPSIVCRNQECSNFSQAVNSSVIATVPPIMVDGQDDFWYEFQGGDVEFCFLLGHCCGSIIAFNAADCRPFYQI